MQILLIRTVQSAAFRILIEALKEILTDVNIVFIAGDEETKKSGGMRIMAMNNAKSVLIHLKLDAHNFDQFDIKTKKITIGVNMLNLYRLIKTMSNNDTLSLYIDSDNINKLGIRIENGEKNSVSNFKLNLLDLEDDDIEVPPTEFESVLTMPSSDFHKLCRDMYNIGIHIEIKSVSNENIMFSCKGDFASQETILGQTDNGMCIEKIIAEENEARIVQGVYELKHLVQFTKCTNLCNNITIFMKNDYPLIIKYTVASLGHIHLCLTPIIDNNDDMYDM